MVHKANRMRCLLLLLFQALPSGPGDNTLQLSLSSFLIPSDMLLGLLGAGLGIDVVKVGRT